MCCDQSVVDPGFSEKNLKHQLRGLTIWGVAPEASYVGFFILKTPNQIYNAFIEHMLKELYSLVSVQLYSYGLQWCDGCKPLIVVYILSSIARQLLKGQLKRNSVILVCCQSISYISFGFPDMVQKIESSDHYKTLPWIHPCQ